MMSEEARIGARVIVGESGFRPEFWGLTGTVRAKWGNPEYLALDVLLDDGRTHLFRGTTSWRRSVAEAHNNQAQPEVADDRRWH